MKRHLLILLMAIVATTMSLKAQTIVIDDGFENGIQDSIWTQEFVIGEHPWAVEAQSEDLQWPKTVKQGSKRAYLRNTSGETEGYVTRLVSKVMDLSPAKVYQPILVFWYANPKWTADRDTLRVLYKTGPNANWKQLAEYSSASASWQKVNLQLPEVNETYQIAFEGTDNLGRGIVLDSVKLRSAPECTVPHDLTVTSLGAGKANIAWNASWDADFYDLIIALDSIDPDTVPANYVDSIIAFNKQVSGAKQNYEVELKSGEYYYAYVRSVCAAEKSLWNSEATGQFRFRVKATKYLPYSYGFNLDYDAGMLHRDPEWTWGTNTGHYNPHINTNLNNTELKKYSEDGTRAVVFSGANNSTTAIPAGQYAYVATPDLSDSTVANLKLSDCQVSFWATVATYTGQYAHSIIVGIMTDPEDVTTFVPIDTVSVWGCNTFQENIVSFENYNGDGTYVAFASAFEKQNLFYIDNVTVERRPAVNKVTKITVNPRDTYAEISWEGNAASYKVLITNKEVNPDKPASIDIVDSAVVTTNSYTCDKLTAAKTWDEPYYVYVKAEDKAWSYRYPFITITGIKELPMKFDMEQSSGYYVWDAKNYPQQLSVFSNDVDYPYLYTTNPYKEKSCLYMSKDPGNDTWVTFPMVDSIQNKQMSFYLSGNTTPTQSSAIVGVMSNPMDINTFIPVNEFKVAAAGYIRCFVDFSNYEGPNGVIAIVWGNAEDPTKNTNNYIDNVTIEPLAECLPPAKIYTVATSDSVTVSWDKSNVVNTWEVLITKEAMSIYTMEQTLPEILKSSEGKRNVVMADTVQWLEGTNNPTFGFGGLEWSSSYYIYVRAMCGEDLTWWAESTFKTICPEKFKVPYLDDFERYETSSLEAGCWYLKDFNGTGYPKILSPSSGAQSGNMLELWSTTTTHRNLAALPPIDVDDYTDMLFGFDARSYGTTTKSVLYVGTMSDLNDTTTFVAFDTIYMAGGTSFYHIVYDMNDYQLPNKQLVITSGLGGTLEMNSDTYIDNVFIKSSRCAAPYDIEATDVQRNTMDITWNGKTDDKWEVKVLSKYAKLNTKTNSIEPYDTAKVAIINDTIVNARALHIEGLKAQTKYYIYIRPTCGDSIWAVDSIRSGCVKIDPTKPNKETFESYPSGTSYADNQQADCWTVGNGNPSAATTYIPFIYKSATYASSGENTYRFYPTSANSPTWVATPEIECNSMTELAVTFNFYGSTSYYILPGVMIDPEDLNTFVVLDSIKGSGKSVQYTFDLSDYKDTIPENAKYFAWRTAYNAGPTIYLDDVSILKIACPLSKPSVSDLESDKVRISSGLRVDNEWEIILTDSLIELDSVASKSFVIPSQNIVYRDTIAQRSKLITGLEEKTNYYAYTRTLCDSTASQWAMVSFMTPCLALTPETMGTITFTEKEGYTTGSGGAMPCWVTGNKMGATGTRIPYVYGTAGNYYHNGNPSVEFYTSSTTDGAYAIMPQLNVDSIKDYQVNFWGTAWSSGEHKLIVGVVTDPMDLNTFSVIDTVTFPVTPNWTACTVPFDKYEGDFLGNYGKYIMFLSEFGANNDVNITEISVEKIPSCRPVTEILTDSVTADGAMLSWNGDGEKFRLLIADEELVDSIKPVYDKYLIDTIASTNKSVLIGGLEPATSYFAYVQGICADNDSAKISMVAGRFFTNCPTETGYEAPYVTNFDKNTATGTGVHPDCWDGVYLTFDTVGTTQSYPQVSTSNAYSQKNNMYLYSYGYYNSSSKKFTSNTKTIAVAPKVQGNLNDYYVSFYARQSSTGTSYGKKLIVGYVTDASQKGMDSTFVKLGEVDVEGTKHTYYEFSLLDKAAVPAGARIALRADWSLQGMNMSPTSNTSYYANFYVDNFRIGLPPTCYAPTLEVGKTTLTSAEVKITPAVQGGDLWELAVIPDSVYTKLKDINAYLDTTKALVLADSANYVVPGLSAGTTYQVYARTVCGGKDGSSAWTDNPITVITQYYYKDSYSFGFEKSEGWIRSKYSTSDANYLHPALWTGYEGGTASTAVGYYPYGIENTSSYVYGYGPKDGSKGKAGLRFYATTTYYGGYVVFPSIAEPKARSFEFKVRPGYLSYSTMKPSTSYASQIQVGTIDKDGDFDSFELLAAIDLEKLNTATVAAAANDFLFTSISLDIDSATMANKQIVLYQPTPAVSGSSTVYNFVDNVVLDSVKGYGTVSLGKIAATATQATINWNNISGPWNLFVTSYNAKTKKTDTIASYLNLIDTTSQVITGLTPQSEYTVILNAANAPKSTKFIVSATKTFKTPCLPIEPNANGEFFWDFNEKSDWERSDVLVGGANATTTDTCYWKPGCFTVGTTYTGTQTTSTVYYNWLIQRKGYGYTSAPTGNAATGATTSARYEYGRDDSPALRIYSTSSYMTPYIVLPELNCDFDTMMVEFYGRCFANYAADYGTASSKNKVLSPSTYLGTSYSKQMIVGTLTDPNDFSTLEVLDTVTYSKTTTDITTSTLVTADPAGLRYWEKMMIPLGGAKGKYIVLFPPKEKSCLFFLDDLSVKAVGDNIFAPKNPRTGEITKTTAELSWEVKHPTLQSVVVVVNKDDGDKEVVRDTIVGTKYVANGLQPATVYAWYMYQINGELKSSETERVQFTTDCEVITPDYETGFESDKETFWIVPGQTSDTYKQNKCWIYGNAGSSAVSTYIYNYMNSATIGYSHAGNYALRLYAYSTTYQTYAAMPALDPTAYDTLQVNFWMCPGYHGLGTSTNADKISTQYTLGSTESSKLYYYAKSIIVGTMTDPNDPTTFVAIDTITYNGTFAVGDEANASNDYLFQKKKVSLRGATGPYVAFMSTLYAKGAENKSTYDYVWLDDISFSLLQECAEPTDLVTSDVTSKSAKLSWQSAKYNEKYVLQVSTDAEFVYDTAFVFNDTVEATTLALDSLKPFTTYTWRVRALCGEEYGESEFTQNAVFTTARVPFFLEDFRETSLDGDWTVAANPAIEVIDSANVKYAAATSASSYGFHRVTTNYGIYGAHYCAPFYSSSTVSTTTYDCYWLISPVIYLEENKPAHLTMDLALTQSTTTTPNANPATEANVADDFTFMIALSEDGGKTWKKDDILGLWNDTIVGADKLLDIPVEAINKRYDLAKYAGKNVRIAFYREAETYLSTTSAIHIGNIRVAYYDNFVVDTIACQYQDIDIKDYDIFIDGDNAPVGTLSYMSVQRAAEGDAEKGALDTVYNLTAEYFEAPETIMSDTICEGESYTTHDFTAKTRPGIYRRKLQSVEHCDSIITLYLNVTPTQYAEALEQAICPGESFIWNGKPYNRAGLYADTLISSLGCDSIETLVLSYYADEDTIYDDIRIAIDQLPYTYQNAEHPYVKNQAPIVFAAGTAKGVYTEQAWVQGNNCAAVLVLTAEIYDPHEGIEDIFGEDGNGVHKILYNDNLYIISNGKWYNAEGKLVDDPRE